MSSAQKAIDKVRGAGASASATTLYDQIKADRARIASSLPQSMDAERFVMIACGAVRSGRALMKCSAMSVRLAIMEAAQLGMELDGVLGHGYLIPRKNRHTRQMEAEFQIGYRGLILLAERSAGVTINANVVYSNDRWDFEEGTSPFIRHKRALTNRGEGPIAAWCCATKRDGGQTFRVLGPEDVERAKASSMSASGSHSPWTTHVDAMWSKTVVRATLKWLPLGQTEMRAVVADEHRSEGIAVPLGVAGSEGDLDVVDLPMEEATDGQ